MIFLRNIFVACLLVAAPAFAAEEEEEVTAEPAGENLPMEILEAAKMLAQKTFAPSQDRIAFEKFFKDEFLSHFGLPEDEHLAEVTKKFLDNGVERERQLLRTYQGMQQVKELLDAGVKPEEEEQLRQEMRDLIRYYYLTAYKNSGLYEYGPSEEDGERFEKLLTSYIESTNIPLVLEPFKKYT